MKTKTALITGTQALVSASRNGHSIPVYDDGFGDLYIHRDSMGITGIVRAQSWEDAYGICEDEFFPEANETIEALRAEYNVRREHVKILTDKTGSIWEATPEDYEGGTLRPGVQLYRWESRDVPADYPGAWMENALFQEAFGFRPNGPRAGNWENGEPKDPNGHGIYAKDLNGDYLDVLTPELAERLEIQLEIAELD